MSGGAVGWGALRGVTLDFGNTLVPVRHEDLARVVALTIAGVLGPSAAEADREAFLAYADQITLDGQVDKIRVPFLVTHGENDRQVPLWHAHQICDVSALYCTVHCRCEHTAEKARNSPSPRSNWQRGWRSMARPLPSSPAPSPRSALTSGPVSPPPLVPSSKQ